MSTKGIADRFGTCRSRLLTALGVLLILSPLPGLSQEYVIRHDAGDEALYVRACFPAGKGFWLQAEDDNAVDNLLFASLGADTNLRVRDGRMFLPQSQQRRCLRYGIDLEQLSAARSLRRGYSFGESRLVWSGAWLWRPRHDIAGAEIRFTHDESHNISAPWPLLQRTSTSTTFRLDQTPADWRNLIAIGPFKTHQLVVGDSELRLAVLPSEQMDKAKMERWIRATAQALTSVYGRLPLASSQVLVVPIGRGDGPVPWGQVKRGGGTAVHLFVNETLDFESFMDDWTASHEFSHMLHPFFGRSGRWFAEGLASYYQNLSRARAGHMNAERAWQKLNAGFGRGQRDADSLSLRQANRQIHDGRYMRVYWSGAAVALLADLDLRKRSGGRRTLDSVLDQFAACHLPAQRIWNIETFFTTLDEISGTPTFMPLYRRHVDSSRFPDLGAAYRDLGLVDRNGELQLLDVDPKAVALRDQIMTPAQPESAPPACN
jgi:hypothetical protein